MLDSLDEKIINYLKDGLIQSEISRKLNTSEALITYRIKRIRKQGMEIPYPTAGRKKKNEPDEIDEQIIELLKEGLSQAEASRKLNVSEPFITYRIKRMRLNNIEIPYANKGRNRKKEPDETDKEILKLLNNGLNITQISKEMNVSRQAISDRINRMKKNGIENPGLYKSIEIEEKIYKLRKEGLTYREITEVLSRDGRKMTKENARMKYLKVISSEQQLAKGIVNLIKTKHATLEQIQIIAEYYGVDLNRTLNSLNEKER